MGEENNKKEMAKYVAELIKIKLKSNDNRLTELEKEVEILNTPILCNGCEGDWFTCSYGDKYRKTGICLQFKKEKTIRKELSKLKEQYQTIFGGCMDQQKEIEELKELVCSEKIPNAIIELDKRTMTIIEVLRELGEDYKLRHSTGRDEIKKIMDKLGGDTSDLPSKGEQGEGQSLVETSTKSQPPSILERETMKDFMLGIENPSEQECSTECRHFKPFSECLICSNKKEVAEPIAGSASHTEKKCEDCPIKNWKIEDCWACNLKNPSEQTEMYWCPYCEKTHPINHIVVEKEDLKNYYEDLWFLIHWIQDNAISQLNVWKKRYEEIKKRADDMKKYLPSEEKE